MNNLTDAEKIIELNKIIDYNHQTIERCVTHMEQMEKDAAITQLILQECINSIKEWRDASDEHMDKEEYWKGYRSGCNDAIVEIIQRFGVKE